MTRLLPLICAATFSALPTLSALADGHSGSHTSVEVLPGWRTAAGTHMAALKITLDDGWKTYWRAPGEAGIPPEFDWSGSENLAEVRIHWPVPDVFSSNGMTTLGYHHELVLPIELVADNPTADIALHGDLALGICDDICMPMQAEVVAMLTSGSAVQDARITQALAHRPDTSDEAGLVSARCTVAPIADGVRVTAELDMPAVGAGELAVFEPDDRSIWVSEAVTRRAGSVLFAEADLVPVTAQPFAFDTGTLRFTVLADGRAVDIQGCSEIQ